MRSGTLSFLLLWLTIVSVVCEEGSTCDQWHTIAQKMTGSGQVHKCSNDKTKTCTRFDCEGALRRFGVDYCLGIQVNSCLQPLSMDLYVTIPSHNLTNQYRITHDQVIYLPEGQDFFKGWKNIPLLNKVHFRPLLDIEFEREGEDHILVSMTLKVESTTIFPIFLDRFQRKLVDEEKLPIEHCTTYTNATSDKPAKTFMSVPCHAAKYPDLQPRIDRPAVNVTPSDTLNKTCDFTSPCSLRESCGLTSGTKGVCHCQPEYVYLLDQNACVSTGSVGMDCLTDADCDKNELCAQDSNATFLHSCQCDKGYAWDGRREICILVSNPGEGEPLHGGGTDSPHQTNNNSSSSSSSKHTAGNNTMYTVIGGVCVGGVVLVAVMVGGFLLCRSRLRARNQETTGLYDSHAPILSDVDDDVDLVM